MLARLPINMPKSSNKRKSTGQVKTTRTQPTRKQPTPAHGHDARPSVSENVSVKAQIENRPEPAPAIASPAMKVNRRWMGGTLGLALLVDLVGLSNYLGDIATAREAGHAGLAVAPPMFIMLASVLFMALLYCGFAWGVNRRRQREQATPQTKSQSHLRTTLKFAFFVFPLVVIGFMLFTKPVVMANEWLGGQILAHQNAKGMLSCGVAYFTPGGETAVQPFTVLAAQCEALDLEKVHTVGVTGMRLDIQESKRSLTLAGYSQCDTTRPALFSTQCSTKPKN